jgi:hypothetical protein
MVVVLGKKSTEIRSNTVYGVPGGKWKTVVGDGNQSRVEGGGWRVTRRRTSWPSWVVSLVWTVAPSKGWCQPSDSRVIGRRCSWTRSVQALPGTRRGEQESGWTGRTLNSRTAGQAWRRTRDPAAAIVKNGRCGRRLSSSHSRLFCALRCSPILLCACLCCATSLPLNLLSLCAPASPHDRHDARGAKLLSTGLCREIAGPACACHWLPGHLQQLAALLTASLFPAGAPSRLPYADHPRSLLPRSSSVPNPADADADARTPAKGRGCQSPLQPPSASSSSAVRSPKTPSPLLSPLSLSTTSAPP